MVYQAPDARIDYYEPRDGINKTLAWIAKGAQVNPSWLESLMCRESFVWVDGAVPLDLDPTHIFQNTNAMVEANDGQQDDAWDDLFQARLVAFFANTDVEAMPASDLQDELPAYWSYE